MLGPFPDCGLYLLRGNREPSLQQSSIVWEEDVPMRILFSLIFLVVLAAAAVARNEGGSQVDPQTGRAIGARERRCYAS